MNLEIHNPELLQRVNARLQSREFHNVDELLLQALDALDQKVPPPVVTPPVVTPPVVTPRGSLHDFFMNSPLRGADLPLDRERDFPRAVDLE
jgi:hypothetical protein